MPTTYAIPDGRTVMAATLVSGVTGGVQTVSNAVNGVSFQPDLIWTKTRSAVDNHYLVDSVRGTSNYLSSNLTNAEASNANFITAITSSGYSYGSSGYGSGTTLVGWQWKAGGTSSSNTNGSITSTVSANTTAGFSVATYTGNGSAGATFGHGLGVAPSFVIVKERSNANGWLCYHISTGNTGYLELDATLAFQTLSTVWNNTTPSSTVVTLGTVSNVNRNGGTFVAYCFAPVAGYSAFGSYTGNGSADGPFVYTGFRPRWIMVKNTTNSGGATNWVMQDSSRNGYNPNKTLYANASSAEDSSAYFDILSNGFKVRDTFRDVNTSGDTYIYACFAENPFKYANAR